MKPLHETAYRVVLCERHPDRKACSGCRDLRECILANLNKKGDDYFDECRYKLFDQGIDDITYDEWVKRGCVDSGVLINPLKDDNFLKVIIKSSWK